MKFGDIVLLSHPATDFKNIKVRPALIISSDRYNERELDRILLPISKNIMRDCPDDILIKDSDKLFSTTGLRVSSAIRVGKIFTADKCVIKRCLGHLPDEFMNKVREKIKEVLGY